MAESSTITREGALNFMAADDDPWVSGPYGCALVGTEAGMVTMRAASGAKGNKANVAFDVARARKLALLLNMAADAVEPLDRAALATGGARG